MTSPLLEAQGYTNDPCEGAPWLDGDAKEREALRTMLRVPAWITGWTVVPLPMFEIQKKVHEDLGTHLLHCESCQPPGELQSQPHRLV